MSLDIRELSVNIKNKRVIESINLTINLGEIHVVMGPNGVGKTTLIYSILNHPNYKKSGKIFLDNEDITNLETYNIIRKGIGVVLQHNVNIDGLKLSRLLWESSKEHYKSVNEYNNNLNRLMGKLSLKREFLERTLVGFSGGERKRIELLICLMQKPRFLLIDEIDSGLDVDNIKMVAKIINEIKREKGILLITHYTKLLHFLSVDKVYVLFNKRIVKVGGKELALEIESKGYENLLK